MKVFKLLFYLSLIFLILSSGFSVSKNDITNSYIVVFNYEGKFHQINNLNKNPFSTLNVKSLKSIKNKSFENNFNILKNKLISEINSNKLKVLNNNNNNLNIIKTNLGIIDYKILFSGVKINIKDKKILQKIKKLNYVKAVYKDEIITPLILKNTSNFLSLPQIRNIQVNGTNLTGKGVKIAIIDSGVDVKNPDFACNEFTNINSTIYTFNNSINYTLETIHPYNNSRVYTYILNLSNRNLTNFNIHFKNISTEQNFDFIKIYDKNNTLIQKISGNYNNYTSKIIFGDYAKIVLTTDISNVNYGFYIDFLNINGTSSLEIGNCPKIIDQYNYIDNNLNPFDDLGHGTHVASIISANNSNPDLRGVAPDSSLMIYKIFDHFGSGSTSNILLAMQRSMDPNNDLNFSDRADIISMSLSAGFTNDPNTIISLLVDNLSNYGVNFVIAAGNSGSSFKSIASPGSARSAITVGASFKANETLSYTGFTDKIVYFSSRSPTNIGTIKPDLIAPGVNICAAKSSGTTYSSLVSCVDSTHYLMSGTSMATPIVSGLVALIKQAHKNWTQKDIKYSLKSTAIDLNYSPFIQGWGKIDALKTINLQKPACIVEFDTKNNFSNDFTSSNNYLLFAEINNCPNFKNYSFEIAAISNFNDNILNWTLLNTSNNGGKINLTIPKSLFGNVLVKLTAHDLNSTYNNKDYLYLKLKMDYNIKTCKDIVKPGIYNLLNNLNSSNSNCINIKSNDVVINGNNFSIFGNSNYDGISSNGFNNLTVKNLNIYNSQYGIYNYLNNNNFFKNLNIYNSNNGIYFVKSVNNNLINITTYNISDYGIYKDSFSNYTSLLVNTKKIDFAIFNYLLTRKNSLINQSFNLSVDLVNYGFQTGNLTLNLYTKKGLCYNGYNDFKNLTLIKTTNLSLLNQSIFHYKFNNITTLIIGTNCFKIEVSSQKDLFLKNNNDSFYSDFYENKSKLSIRSLNSNFIPFNKSINLTLNLDNSEGILSTNYSLNYSILENIYSYDNNFIFNNLTYDNFSILIENITMNLSLKYFNNTNFDLKIFYNNSIYNYFNNSINKKNYFNINNLLISTDNFKNYNDLNHIYYTINIYKILNKITNLTGNISSLSNIILNNIEIPQKNNISKRYSIYFKISATNGVDPINSEYYVNLNLAPDREILDFSFSLNNYDFNFNSFKISKNISLDLHFSNKGFKNLTNDTISLYYSKPLLLQNIYDGNNQFTTKNPSYGLLNNTNFGVFNISNQSIQINYSNNLSIIKQINLSIGNNFYYFNPNKFSRGSYIINDSFYFIYSYDNNLNQFIFNLIKIFKFKQINISLNTSSNTIYKNINISFNKTGFYSVLAFDSKNLSFLSWDDENLKKIFKIFIDSNSLCVVSKTPKDRNHNNFADACESDIDGDGIIDSIEKNSKGYLIGNKRTISNNLENISLIIANNSNNSNSIFSNISKVEIKDLIKNISRVEFNFNFSNSSLNILDLNLDFNRTNNSKFYGIIKGLNLTNNQTKTIRIEKSSNVNKVCIKDEEINNISQISNNCKGTNEYLLNCNGVSQFNYTCLIQGGYFKISGLKHSGVIEYLDAPITPPSSGGSSSSGGGGSSTPTNFAGGFSSSQNTKTQISHSIIKPINPKLKVLINGDSKLNSNYTGNKKIIINLNTSSKNSIEFIYNFSAKELNLKDLKLDFGKINSSNYLIVNGLNFKYKTKTIKFEKSINSTKVCIKDAQVNSIYEVSNNCGGLNEYILDCNGLLNNGYTCSILDNQYIINGLKHSAVKEYENPIIKKITNNSKLNNNNNENNNSNNSKNISSSNSFLNLNISYFILVLILLIVTLFFYFKKFKNSKDNIPNKDKLEIQLIGKYLNKYKNDYHIESLKESLIKSGYDKKLIEEYILSNKLNDKNL